MISARLSSGFVRRIARVLLAAMMAAALAPPLHGLERHDSDCAPALFVHDSGQHRVAADAPGARGETAEHCAVCHAVRLVRLASPLRVVEAAIDTTVRLIDAGVTPPRWALVLKVPARAPPVLS